MDLSEMSLINSVLRDLDARKSDGPGAGQFQQHVRAVPDQRDKRGRRWVPVAGAAVAVMAIAGGGAWWFNGPRKAPALPLAVKAPATQAVAVGSQAALTPTVPPIVTPVQSAVRMPEPAPVHAGVAPAAAAPTPESAPAGELVPKKEDAPTSPPRGAARLAATRAAEITVDAPVAAPVTAAAPARRAASIPAASATLPATVDVRAAAPETGARAPAQQTTAQKIITASSPQERADNEYTQAVELLRQGKQSAAIQALEQAVRLNARHEGARQALVAALIDMGRKDDAIRYAQDGLAEHVAQPAMAMTLARLQVERGDLRPAVATLERTLPYSAGHTGYEAFLAALLQRDEQHKRAVEHYLVAVQKAPEAGVWWMGLGISYQALQRSGEALVAFKRAKATGSLNAELSAFVDTRLAQLQR
jgi:MSHA biogenesis protein MshN